MVKMELELVGDEGGGGGRSEGTGYLAIEKVGVLIEVGDWIGVRGRRGWRAAGSEGG